MSTDTQTEISNDRALTELAKTRPGLAEQIAAHRIEARARLAERNAARQADEDAKARQADERAEAQLREQLRRQWIAQGGRGADFDARYSDIREAHFADLAASIAGGRTSPRSSVQL